jgi:hypothetical protein
MSLFPLIIQNSSIYKQCQNESDLIASIPECAKLVRPIVNIVDEIKCLDYWQVTEVDDEFCQYVIKLENIDEIIASIPKHNIFINKIQILTNLYLIVFEETDKLH